MSPAKSRPSKEKSRELSKLKKPAKAFSKKFLSMIKDKRDISQ